MTALIRRHVAAPEARDMPVERVRLFGSYATGQPGEGSDIDIAVISPAFDAVPRLQRREQHGSADRDLRVPLDILGCAPSQAARCEPGSFLAEILETGVAVPLHGPTATHTRRRR
jgi:predicted nucleotidyltransferase